MRTINLESESVELSQVLTIARTESVLLLTNDGDEFLLSRADDFDSEVESLRNSPSFQTFLDKRMNWKTTFPIEEIEKEIELMKSD
jgi:hypothetical protein